MATLVLPPAAVDPHMPSGPWREEECNRFYVELDLLPLPFDAASREPPDPWASLTSALPHRSQHEVVAFAHAEYLRMYTDPNHAQLLQDFALGLWSAQDDSVFEAAIGSAAETDTEPLDLLAKCLPHKSAAAIKEQVHHPVLCTLCMLCTLHAARSAPLHQVDHLQDDVRAIENAEPPLGHPGAQAALQTQSAQWPPALGHQARALPLGGAFGCGCCGGGASAAGSSMQHQGGGVGGNGGGVGYGLVASTTAAVVEKKRERGTPWTEEEHKVGSAWPNVLTRTSQSSTSPATLFPLNPIHPHPTSTLHTYRCRPSCWACNSSAREIGARSRASASSRARQRRWRRST